MQMRCGIEAYLEKVGILQSILEVNIVCVYYHDLLQTLSIQDVYQ